MIFGNYKANDRTSPPQTALRVGAELHSPRDMFLGLSLRFKSDLRNSGRIYLTAVRKETSLPLLIHHQNREILMMINFLKFTGFGPLLCKSGSMLRIEYKGKIRTRVVPSTIVVSIFSKDNPFFRTHINVKNPKRDPCLYSFGVISHDLLGYNLLSPCFA